MGHHNAIPGPGSNPALLPTAAQKAALDNASPALSGSNVVVGSSQITTLPTAAQKGSLDATGSLDGTNAIMTFGPNAAAFTLDQAIGLSANLALSNANPVAARSNLLQMALTLSTSMGTVATWATGRLDLTASYLAVGVYLNSGAFEMIQGAINTGTGDVTFTSTSAFSGSGSLLAFLFQSNAPVGNITFA